MSSLWNRRGIAALLFLAGLTACDEPSPLPPPDGGGGRFDSTGDRLHLTGQRRARSHRSASRSMPTPIPRCSRPRSRSPRSAS